MRRIKLVCIPIMMLCLSACGNKDSKVDKVIQDKIQESDGKTSEDVTVNTTETIAYNVTVENTENIDNEGADDEIPIGSDETTEGSGGEAVSGVATTEIETTEAGADSNTDISTESNESTDNDIIVDYTEADIDVDLTTLSSTMVYSEVYNMMCEPDKYMGKVVKMKGEFAIYQDETTGKLYFACIVSDATACCAQGIEFERSGNCTYPDDYPEVGEDATIIGVFETYEENGYSYLRLKNAKMY